ncbi:betaine-aldehyde dehydrogenase [Haematobacter massiliensis]|uniref:Betaine aldehyde dehydrogenase n=1 Tax=Haematobacter massiliensis TaxID=195105 RepID=A0A086XZ61_9RHOB|nr:betaine-aldehyde dehydrogenase [Haematobacter massiliensis]KFI27311.1 betaine-aldehyde dehydrogenase [Haematobacter massiliensis]OWJ70729.1 betaine-aldehyde dehydrogenase [Haematobacter massiliensis]OWJ84791.1 betaine-aldehyde dehydrogenase [Haematobacter massiliensis]QBJ23757.1 betaine-aldehyde dehydrogenase [Haematobacter massiliensis]
MRAQPQASHFIDGAFVEDISGAEIEVIYPATGEVIARLHEATPAIMDRALNAARRAQRDWAALRPVERGRILNRAAQIMRERNRALSELETLDTGKPLQETLVADAMSGADALEYFAGLAPTVTGETIPLGQDFVYTRREPVGVCVGIGAWNYPTQIACWKAAPALALGNAMVFKPSETTPLGALKLAEILVEAGLPPGLFNVVQGRGAVGAALVTDPRVDKVSLTGSVATGAKVYAAAAEGIRSVTMELGGKSPLVVFEDADLDSAVGAAMLGNFYSSGQICSNGTRVFVQKSVREAFLDRLVRRSRAIRLGDPLDEATQMGPLVSQAQFDKVMGYISRAEAEGAQLMTGGRQWGNAGLFVEPTVFAGVTDGMTLAREEVFGPVMAVLDFETEEEALTRANATPYGLAAGVFTADMTRAHRMAAGFEAGTCWINAYNLTPVEAPFGGMKLSGVGRENGRAAVEHYTQIKSVYVGLGPVEAPY